MGVWSSGDMATLVPWSTDFCCLAQLTTRMVSNSSFDDSTSYFLRGKGEGIHPADLPFGSPAETVVLFVLDVLVLAIDELQMVSGNSMFYQTFLRISIPLTNPLPVDLINP